MAPQKILGRRRNVFWLSVWPSGQCPLSVNIYLTPRDISVFSGGTNIHHATDDIAEKLFKINK